MVHQTPDITTAKQHNSDTSFFKNKREQVWAMIGNIITLTTNTPDAQQLKKQTNIALSQKNWEPILKKLDTLNDQQLQMFYEKLKNILEARIKEMIDNTLDEVLNAEVENTATTFRVSNGR